jgi:hypothetical protein
MVKFSLCISKCYVMRTCQLLNEAPHHEDVLESGGKLHTLLASALDGGEWSASHPGHFNPRVRTPGTHWVGSWVGPSADLNTVGKREVPIISPPGNCVACS